MGWSLCCFTNVLHSHISAALTGGDHSWSHVWPRGTAPTMAVWTQLLPAYTTHCRLSKLFTVHCCGMYCVCKHTRIIRLHQERNECTELTELTSYSQLQLAAVLTICSECKFERRLIVKYCTFNILYLSSVYCIKPECKGQVVFFSGLICCLCTVTLAI